MYTRVELIIFHDCLCLVHSDRIVWDCSNQQKKLSGEFIDLWFAHTRTQLSLAFLSIVQTVNRAVQQQNSATDPRHDLAK